MLPFLLINILVSTVTVVLVWSALQRRGAVVAEPNAPILTPTFAEVASNSPDIQNAVVDQSAVSAVDSADIPSTAIPATPVPTEQSGPIVHVVQPGDSMGGISVQYDVSIDEIMAANELDDPNTIFVGQELIISLAETAVVAAEPEIPPTQTPIPTLQVGTSIFEITAVNNPGDVATEQVVIANVGPQAVDLSNWSISDDLGDTYTFPYLLLFGGGAAVTLNSTAGPDAGLIFYWDREVPAWESGNVLILRNAEGEIAAEFTVP
jgi:LysM repeat protein